MFLKKQMKVLKRFETYISSSKNCHPKSKPRTYKKEDRNVSKTFLKERCKVSKWFETYILSSRIVIQNRSTEPTKKKIETLVKRFLKNKESFETIRNLRPVMQESSFKIEAQIFPPLQFQSPIRYPSSEVDHKEKKE